MMNWIISLIISAVVLLIAAKVTPKVEIRNFGTAIVVALIIGILSALIGWLLTFVLHLATLGIPYLLGLGFLIKIIANAIVIKIADAMHGGFRVHGFTAALILAAVVALVSTILDRLLYSEEIESAFLYINQWLA